MPFLKFVGLTILLVTASSFAWAVSCQDLDTQEKMRAFLAESRQANPLFKDQFSAQLTVSPCEKENCSKKNIAKRKEKESTIHSMRLGEERRTFFMAGKDHPICVVSKGIRQFKCSDCGATFNDQCRSFNTSTAIEGTNIDSIDMELLVDPNFELSCKPVPKSTKFFVVEAIKKSGDSPYDKIAVYHEGARGVMIQIRYFAQNVLRKVYRLSLKQFIQVNEEWVSTDIKVRTVQGSEKKYTFETRIKVVRDNGKHVAYPDPTADPYLDGTPMNVLFSTN